MIVKSQELYQAVFELMCLNSGRASMSDWEPAARNVFKVSHTICNIKTQEIIFQVILDIPTKKILNHLEEIINVLFVLRLV